MDELGECVASREGLGHSCWMIAGTLCDGTVQGTAAQKHEVTPEDALAALLGATLNRYLARVGGGYRTKVREAWASYRLAPVENARIQSLRAHQTWRLTVNDKVSSPNQSASGV